MLVSSGFSRLLAFLSIVQAWKLMEESRGVNFRYWTSSPVCNRRVRLHVELRYWNHGTMSGRAADYKCVNYFAKVFSLRSTEPLLHHFLESDLLILGFYLVFLH